MTDWYDKGFALFKKEPELSLADVGWRAPHQHKDDWFAFVLGYSDARKQKDDYQREKKSAIHG